MTFTVYTHPELRRALAAVESGDEIVIAFEGGMANGPVLVSGRAEITVRHAPEPPS